MKFPSVLAAASLLFSPCAAGAGIFPDYGDGYLTLYVDNDLFSGSDKDYTNGGRISWISGNRPVAEIRGVQRWLRYLIGDESSAEPFRIVSGFDDSSAISYNFGFALTQLMYTPEDPESLALIPGERPYAGVLLLGFSLHAMDQNVLNTVAFSVGTVGRHAYAEETQDFVHSVRGMEKFNGWDNQVPNEPLFNLHLSQKRRLLLVDYRNGIFAVDGFHESAIGIGNYRTEAQVGALIRVGFNLPVEFSDPRLSPQAYSHKLFQDERVSESFWSLYAILGARGYAIARDVTLDGPMFRGGFETDVSREPWVAEAYAGFGLRLSDWELSYIHTFRTKEYDTQNGDLSFGSIAIRKSF